MVWHRGAERYAARSNRSLNKALAEALADPKMKSRIAELGGVPMPMSPAEFGKLVADETEKWGKVVKFAGISVE